jgi:hypothetical protein
LCEPSFTLIKIPPYCPILGPLDEILICLIRFSHLSNFVEFINPQLLLRTSVIPAFRETVSRADLSISYIDMLFPFTYGDHHLDSS